jgi:hypothetical protein
MDRWVKDMLDQLEEDGLTENTIVFSIQIMVTGCPGINAGYIPQVHVFR